jgi:hypothetical protein
MIYEYAVDPDVFTTYDRFRFIDSNFGVSMGRAISEFPKKWKKLVWEVCKHNLRDMEIKRATERFSKFKQKLTRRRGVPYDSQHPWHTNAQQEHQRKPFHAILGCSNSGCSEVLDIGLVDETDELWCVRREMPMPRSAAALAQAVGPLIRMSKELVIVDPHFNPTENRWKDVLSALLDCTTEAESDCQRIELHVTDTKSNGESKWELNWFVDECQRQLPHVLPSGRMLRVIVWRQKEGGERLHARYVITERGGIRVEGGLDSGPEGQTSDISLLDDELYRRRWNDYQRDSGSFEFVEEFEISGARQTQST